VITVKKITTGIIVLALVAAVLFFLVPSRKKLVKKRLTRLVEYAYKDGEEAPLTMMAKASGMGKLFTKSCLVTMENSSMEKSYSRRELMDQILVFRRSFSRLRVTFHDISIRFPGEDRAKVLLTMRIAGKQAQEQYSDTREIELTLERSEKKWLISRVVIVEVLER